MVKVIVLGAHGQVAQLAEKMFYDEDNVETTLFLRNAARMAGDKDKATITEYAKAAKLIEKSDLDYTIIRPSWMTNKDEVDYQKTKKGEPITNTEISRKSIASYINELVNNLTEDVHESIGLEKPGTEGDKPSWY